MMRQLLTVTALLAAGLHAQITPARIEGAQSGPVLGRPFSATEVRKTLQTMADGTRIEHSDTTRFYRDGQGRMRAESPNRVEIFDFVAGFEYDLNPESKTYKRTTIPDKTTSMMLAVVGSTSWTSFSSDAPETRTRARNSRGTVTEELPAQTLHSLSIKGSRVTSTIPVGALGNDREMKVVNERWYSPDLQVLIRSSNSDPRFGVSSYELTDIVQAPPDPLLFQVPADYTVRSDH
jgi:hypothetical protein